MTQAGFSYTSAWGLLGGRERTRCVPALWVLKAAFFSTLLYFIN